jgi:CBS domain-containing protein/PII-like signaling protein
MMGPGKRLRVYIGESDRWQGKPLFMALLETLKKEGLAGATVTRGVAGFGAHSRIHTATLESLSADLPLVVEVVDRPDQIDKAIAVIGPMVREGLITVEEVQIEKYTHRELQPLPGDRLVSKVMTQDVATVRPDTPIVDVIDLLIGKMYKALPVVDDQRRVVGLITDGDLLTRGGLQQRTSVTERLDRETLAAQMDELRGAGKTAKDVMTSPVLTTSDDAALAHAVSLMVKRKLKRLPVVDANNRLVGMLSRVDVLRTVEAGQLANHLAPATQAMGRTVGEVMEPTVPTVPLEAELADIADQMARAALKRLIVVDAQGRAVGSINDGDLVARIEPRARPGLLRRLTGRARAEALPETTAAQLMTSGVLSGPASTPIEAANQLMLTEKRKRFVVVDEAGRPIGIVDRQMLLHAVAGAN